MITKYEYNQMKKEEKARKRAEKKKKRAEKKFKRQSKSRYTFLDRTVVKGLSILSWTSSFGYVGYTVYKEYDTIEPTLIKEFLALVIFVIIFSIFIRVLLKHLKLREQANTVASNQGLPSLKYSPVVTIFIRAFITLWLLSIFWLFANISIEYSVQLTEWFTIALHAVFLGFFFRLWASIFEQGTLKRIRTNKLNAEHRTQMMIQDLHKKN